MNNCTITNWLKKWQIIFWIIGVIVVVTLAFGRVSYSTAKNAEEIIETKEDVGILKAEGCKPAVKNTLDIALMQKDVSIMKEDISEMRTEQKEGFKEILERLPRND